MKTGLLFLFVSVLIIKARRIPELHFWLLFFGFHPRTFFFFAMFSHLAVPIMGCLSVFPCISRWFVVFGRVSDMSYC